MNKYDVIIIGAGAAGLSAARAALARGRTVAVLDLGDAPARKVAVSGGGRCNFTNMAASRDRYVGTNPDFVRSCIATFTPIDMLTWMDAHHLSYIEKAPGQYFCASGADDVVNALMRDASGADFFMNTQITNIEKSDDQFILYAKNGVWSAGSIIVATGGVSYANLGVSDFGYKIAKKFGHKITQVEPGLVGLKTSAFDAVLSGLSLPVDISVSKTNLSGPGTAGSGVLIQDSLLFTHFGIGGPAAYRASLFDIENGVTINFAPDIEVYEWLRDARLRHAKKSFASVLSLLLPAKLAKWFAVDDVRRMADISDRDFKTVAARINNFKIPKLKRRGFDGAEVASGGVSTDKISSKTMESQLVPGLFFAGEVLDITGDLGGFNLHFAFSSGIAAGRHA